MKNVVASLLSALLLAGCGAAGPESGPADNQAWGAGDEGAADEPVAAAQQKLNNGTFTTTLYPEVVQILIHQPSGKEFLCTATAIADDMLLTAWHCLKDGSTVASWAKVYSADADNDSAEGAYSSYFVMNADRYSNVYDDGDETTTEATEDMAVVVFGKQTFKKSLPFAYKSNEVITNSTVLTQVGFGDHTTKAYATTTLSYQVNSTSSSSYGYIRTSATNLSENGDSGGPLLYKASDGQNYVVGTLQGGNVFASVTRGVANQITTLMSSRDKYCVQAYKDTYSTSWATNNWAFCLNTSINNELTATGFSKPFQIYTNGRDSSWNDQITGLSIPQYMTVSLFQNSGYGGSAITFSSAFPFLSNDSVENLKSFSFNDMASSWKVTYAGGTSLTLHLKSEVSGKCLDVANNASASGTNVQQYDCSGGNAAQEFQLVSTSTENVYQIKHISSGKCVEVAGGSADNSANVQIGDCSSSSSAQLFKFEQFPSQNKFHMVNTGSSKCVEVAGGSTSNGGNIQQWECLSSSSSWVNDQIFSFVAY